MKDQLKCWGGADPDAEQEGRTYRGVRNLDGTTAVSVDGQPLDMHRDFRRQSATAFDWGYAGAGGPAQLAFAILADHWANDRKARRYYELFVRDVIGNLPSHGWSITGYEIDASLGDDSQQPSAGSLTTCQPSTT
jgi:hypothetical protein